MYYIGLCPFCRGGAPGIRVCGHNHMLVICDECYALWLHTDITAAPHFLEEFESRCPYGDDTLFSDGAHWASRDEIVEKGWWDAVRGEGSSIWD